MTPTSKKIMLLLCKEFSKMHTITSLAGELHLSRVGMWKALKKLEASSLITIQAVNTSKTSTNIIKLDWSTSVTEKTIALYLTEESFTQKRWLSNFEEIWAYCDFFIVFGSILHSPSDANDIDVMGIISQKKHFIKIQEIIEKIQKTQTKKIHFIGFTPSEFTNELLKRNPAIIDSVKKGTVLFGQEKYTELIKNIQTKWQQ